MQVGGSRRRCDQRPLLFLSTIGGWIGEAAIFRRVNWAEEYEFAATLGVPGAVAQLGERERGTLEVTGSSPVGSI